MAHQRASRPAEVEQLIGDASKGRRVLGWEPSVTFEQLIEMMVDADYEQLKHQDSSLSV